MSMSFAERTRKRHADNGYEVECVKYGQKRPYADIINIYRVRDMDGRSEDEVRDYCITEVCRADYPKKHSLMMHLREFKRESDGWYTYVAGHHYTG